MLNFETYLGFKAYIEELTQRGGPVEEDYLKLNEWIVKAHSEGADRDDVKVVFPKILWERKPYGPRSLFERIINAGKVVGTYDIMRDLYSGEPNNLLSPLEQKWDGYIQHQISALAVRHRAEHLRTLLHPLHSNTSTSVLDVACGSGVAAGVCLEYRHMPTFSRYVGVDADIEAIDYCQKHYTGPVSFLHMPLRRLRPSSIGLYSLVWCSGLFDYFSADAIFIKAAKMLLNLGSREIVIGNMGPANLSIPMMNMLGWKLYYRSRTHLYQLALEIIGSYKTLLHFHIVSDPTGVQHYLHFHK